MSTARVLASETGKPESTSCSRRQRTTSGRLCADSAFVSMFSWCLAGSGSYPVPARPGPAGSLAEPTRELLDDPGREHVRHVQDVTVDRVVGCDVGVPLALEPGDRFSGRQVEVPVHLRLHRSELPVT